MFSVVFFIFFLSASELILKQIIFCMKYKTWLLQHIYLFFIFIWNWWTYHMYSIHCQPFLCLVSLLHFSGCCTSNYTIKILENEKWFWIKPDENCREIEWNACTNTSTDWMEKEMEKRFSYQDAKSHLNWKAQQQRKKKWQELHQHNGNKTELIR